MNTKLAANFFKFSRVEVCKAVPIRTGSAIKQVFESSESMNLHFASSAATIS
jgi:hypothetical protein